MSCKPNRVSVILLIVFAAAFVLPSTAIVFIQAWNLQSIPVQETVTFCDTVGHDACNWWLYRAMWFWQQHGGAALVVTCVCLWVGGVVVYRYWKTNNLRGG